MASSYSDVTCDGIPELVHVLSKDGKTYLQFNETSADMTGYATDVEFQHDRIVLHLDVDGDGKPDRKMDYRDCTKEETERTSVGWADVDCDGKTEKIQLKGNRAANTTKLSVYDKNVGLPYLIILIGYPVDNVVIQPEQVYFKLDINRDGLPDEEYGHECEPPDFLRLPYLIIDEESENPITHVDAHPVNSHTAGAANLM